MKIVLIVVFILTACGLFLLLSGILKLPTLRTGRAMMQSGKKEKKLQKTLDAFYMDGAAYLGKYIGMNAYKKSRMQNVLNAAGLKMTPETYMAYAYLKAGSIFLLILPALHVFPLLAIMLVLLGDKKSRRAGKGKKGADRGGAVPFCFHHHTGTEKQQGCTFHAGAL